MAIEFRCDHCSKMMRTPDDSGGKRGRCPHCNETTQIPNRSTAGMNQPIVEQTFDEQSFAPTGQSQLPAHGQLSAPNSYSPSNYSGQTPYKGIISLVLGIVSIVSPLVGLLTICCCWPVATIFLVVSVACGIPAILLGYLDLRGIKQGVVDDAGRGLALTGLILGSVGTIVSSIILVVSIVFFVIAINN